MAAERYRWVSWQKGRKTDPRGNYGYMWDEEDERLVSPAELASALNAAEDAGRWRDDVRFLLGFVPEWAKEVPEGLDPTFYGTLSAAGDREVKARVDAIRQALKAEPKEVQ